MKHIATIEIWELDQPGFKGLIYKPGEDAVDLKEVYADKPAPFFQRVKDAVKELLGWK